MTYMEFLNQVKKQLGQLEAWLQTAQSFATSKGFDANVLAGVRLAPDQFALARQVQIACDTAKFGFARLAGREAPSHADTETTLDELIARIQSVSAYLRTFQESDFTEAPTRTITQPRWEGRTMTGANYFLEHVVPNFYFHLCTTYALLRHNGVPLGKRDYLGALTQQLPG